MNEPSIAELQASLLKEQKSNEALHAENTKLKAENTRLEERIVDLESLIRRLKSGNVGAKDSPGITRGNFNV